MKRLRPALLALLLVLGVWAVATVVLNPAGSARRLPDDLSRSSDSPLLRYDAVPLRDPTPRTLWPAPLESGMELTRGDERLILPLEDVNVTVLGVAGGVATLLKARFPIAAPTGSLTLLRRGIAENETPTTRFSLTLPPEIQWVEDAALSPDGQSIAWQVRAHYDWPGIALLRRSFPRLVSRIAPRRTVEIWRSDAEGGHMERLATAPIDALPVRRIAVGWEERTGRVAALWNDQVYVVP